MLNDDQDMKKLRISNENQNKMQETMIRMIFLHGSECLRTLKQDEKKILTAEISWPQKIAKVSRLLE